VKTIVISIKFLLNVVRQKLLKSANVSRSYSENKSGTFFPDHGVEDSLVSSFRVATSAL